ncbi:MAG: methylated-DNA--[protein]-cysteine S-methyltransferase [Sulfuricurvum sp.]|uniref:methylated-DNA--[protein]-cysteine S-methyltransferase n=1 Tax=Sulfuricurvum sp. TaxID=2025608 RepID=UPI0027326053|nr:methylated-DNA--[protein]-cysteine S-methyltransferase [Sulfuricurvum sp.]MDP3292998.1 methylated-DNA--[protein]-cysteine S-methyltransferase [Sulfuricurvum sp.]
MKNYIRLIHTPIGKMIAAADENAITSLDFTNESELIQNSDTPLLLRLDKELHEYFAGKRKVFTLPLSVQGTPFQKQVWETLLTIPYGITISYASEAERFGNPKAIRAVASANGRNPIAILIPCHRVIASDGTLGGYSGGIEKKEFLLELEQKFAL